MNTVFNFFAQDEVRKRLLPGARAPCLAVFAQAPLALQEESFHLVDNRPPQRKQFGPRRFQPRQFPNRNLGGRDTGRDQGGGAERERLRRERQQSKKQQQWNNFQGNRGFGNQGPSLSASIDIRPEWAVLEQIQLSALAKLSYDVGAPEELLACGGLSYFDKGLDRATPKSELMLRRLPAGRPLASASDDPVLKRLAAKPPAAAARPSGGDGPDAGAPSARVFATDAVLAALMCAPRSVYSWDIIITRDGLDLWLDRRPASSFDQLTVNETAQEPNAEDKDSINGVEKLSAEATAANVAFARQAVAAAGGKRREFADADPFAADHGSASLAFRYRQWRLDDSTLLLVRCELNAALDYKGEELVCTVKALNEFDSKVSGMDWRQKIETQRGAVLATELKNNANKLAKWTCAALLAGADQMKIGYISRVHPKDASAHVILATQTHKPRDFAAQINLSINNMWGILKTVVDLCKALPEGKYVLVKDPSKPLLRLYEVSGGSTSFAGDYAEEAIEA